MLHFNELLNEMMQHHQLRAVDVCEELHIGKSNFSKWRSGAALPGSMDAVNKLANAMRLSIHEKEALFSAYKLSRFGISYYHMTEAVEQLFLSDFVCRKRTGSDIVQYSPSENGRFFTNKGRVVVAIRQILRHGQGKLRMLFQPECDDICGVIREELAEQGRKCSWLLYLNDVNVPSPENISMFFHALPLMADGVEVRCSYINIRSFYEYSMFPFMLITDSAVLVMNRDCSAGMYLQSEESIHYYQQEFAVRYQKASLLGRSFSSAEEFLSGNGEIFAQDEKEQKPCELYIAEKYPCVLYECNGKAVYQYIADLPDKGAITKKYLEFLHYQMMHVNRIHVIFSMEGMQEFFEAEEFYEFSRKLVQPLPLQMRRKLFRLLIGHAEKSDGLEPKLLLRSFLDHSKIRVVNIWSDGRMIFMLELAEEYRILAVREKSLAASLISYLDFLQECGRMLSKKETLKRMHEAWDQYGNPGCNTT